MYHAIVQARMGSKRLPGKSLMEYNNITPLEVLIKRIKKIKNIKLIIIATTKLKKDDIFLKYAKSLNVKLYRGSNINVLERYYAAAKFYNSKNIIRLTADCPFIDQPTLIKMIKLFNTNKYDYISNTYPLPCTFPDGSDIEIFNFEALKKNKLESFLPSDKEHVTKYFWKSKKFKCFRLDNVIDLSKYRYTIDIVEDFNLFKSIIKKYKNFLNLDMKKIIKFIDQNPNLIKYQKKIKRNFGWNESLKKDKLY
tara:strand:+ start:896 stop:1651 length:756 start_codon:yes stop_codon:yes gene_type:complete